VSAGMVSQNAGMISSGVPAAAPPTPSPAFNGLVTAIGQTPYTNPNPQPYNFNGSNLGSLLTGNQPTPFAGVSNIGPQLSSPIPQYTSGGTAALASAIPPPSTATPKSTVPAFRSTVPAFSSGATSALANSLTPNVPTGGIAGAIYGKNPVPTGGIAGSLGTGGALSDEDAKSDIDDPEQLQGFLDSVHAHSYRYKDPDMPGAGHGTFVSPMAQEIESTDLGKSAVSTGPDGYKRVDYGKLQGTMLAGQAMLNERMNKLESFLKAAR